MHRIIAGVMNWGQWGAQLKTSEMARLIGGCVDMGVNTFDHADIYGGHTTEAEWGAAFQKSGVTRSKVELITKCGIMYPSKERPHISYKHYDTTSGHIIRSVEQSLKNLQTDYIDTLLIHRPSPLMHPDEVSMATDQLRSRGLVKKFGISNFSIPQSRLINTSVELAYHQVEISLFRLDAFMNGTLDECMMRGMIPQAWSPLGGGRLYKPTSDTDRKVIYRLQSIADKYGWELDEMSYLFLFHHPAGIRPVVGSTKIERIATAVEASHTIISDAQWFEIWTAAAGEKVP